MGIRTLRLPTSNQNPDTIRKSMALNQTPTIRTNVALKQVVWALELEGVWRRSHSLRLQFHTHLASIRTPSLSTLANSQIGRASWPVSTGRLAPPPAGDHPIGLDPVGGHDSDSMKKP